MDRLNEAFLCETDPVSAETLAQGLELKAWLRLRKGEPEGGLYQEVLRLNPHHPEPVEEGSQAVLAHRTALDALKQRSTVEVQLPAEALSGWKLWLNGAEVRASQPLKLTTGQHYLQLIGLDGRVKYAQVLALTSPNEATPLSWPALERLPPGRLTVLASLQAALQRGVLTGEQRVALEKTRQQLEAQTLVLLTAVSCGQLAGVQVQAETIRLVQPVVPCEQEAAGSKSKGKVAAAVLGGLALGLGGWTGYQYLSLNGTLVLSETERQALLSRYVLSAGGTGLAAVGAAVSTGLVWSKRW